jgi:hypothetical protein
MSRSWNGKAFIDRLAVELWDSSATFRGYLIDWLNEIQDDIVSEIPIRTMRIKLKKLLPIGDEIINLSPEIPGQTTAVIASGGSLTDTSTYTVYTTFLIYNEDGSDYIESEPSVVSAESLATAVNKTIDLTGIPTYSGSTSVEPLTIYRRIYVATEVSGETVGEPFFSADILDNTTTTLSITTEPTSTITPPSDSEVDQISSEQMVFAQGDRYLTRIDANRIKRFNPGGSDSATPSSFDFNGVDSIVLWPKLSSGATTDQRTLSYSVLRRSHEVFYDITRKIDLPIVCRKALIAGVIWKAYEFRDRNGTQTKASNYEVAKKQLKDKLTRQRGRPGTVRDVNGDTQGYEV